MLLALAGCVPAKPIPFEQALAGAWGGDQVLVRFEPKKCILHENGKLDIFAIRYDDGQVILSSQGQTMIWAVAIQGDQLTLSSAADKLRLRFTRLQHTPAELQIRPRQLTASTPLPADRVQEIARELVRRKVEDQAVRLDPQRLPDQPRVDADNYAYLLKLIDEVGWIDAGRFGRDSAVAAFLIAQHSGDLALLLAVLPLVEADARAGRIGLGHFASMYDRVQILQAEPQRYGTQLGRNDLDEMLVLPLQDRARVDDYRKEVGLPPLADYLDDLQKRHGWKIRFADP